MEKIQANMCFDVVFLSKNITYLFSCLPVFSPFSTHFYPHYIIMVKGPLY